MFMCSLPERIRPTVVAFGGVADGFVPFEGQPASSSSSSVDGEQSKGAELGMASIVMKAVQVGTQHAQRAQQSQRAQRALHMSTWKQARRSW